MKERSLSEDEYGFNFSSDKQLRIMNGEFQCNRNDREQDLAQWPFVP